VALLLDTHAAVWWLTDSPRLPKAAREAVATAVDDEGVFVSAISGIEVALEDSRRPMPPVEAFVEGAEASGFRVLLFDMQDAIAFSKLPRLHADPFDRALAAQAQRRNLTLMTADLILATYPIAIYRL